MLRRYRARRFNAADEALANIAAAYKVSVGHGEKANVCNGSIEMLSDRGGYELGDH